MPSRQITDLDERLQGVCVQHIALCNGNEKFKKKDATLFANCTYRSGEEQNYEWEKGRKIKGIPCLCGNKVNVVGSCLRHPLGLTVTNAKAGDSPHNCTKEGSPAARAYDVAIRLPDGKCAWDDFPELWDVVVSTGQSLGLEAGRYIKKKNGQPLGDSPHFQLFNWKSLDKR